MDFWSCLSLVFGMGSVTPHGWGGRRKRRWKKLVGQDEGNWLKAKEQSLGQLESLGAVGAGPEHWCYQHSAQGGLAGQNELYFHQTQHIFHVTGIEIYICAFLYGMPVWGVTFWVNVGSYTTLIQRPEGERGTYPSFWWANRSEPLNSSDTTLRKVGLLTSLLTSVRVDFCSWKNISLLSSE